MAAIWICLCAFLNCAGWILSGLHALSPAGYLIAFAPAAAVWMVWQRRMGCRVVLRWNGRKLRRRFRRRFPLAFLVLAALAFLGGALHAPSNYDGLAYRVPRILHWLADGQWHWIHTDFQRLNVRTCGYEWVAAPLIAFTHTDRLLFLLNTISFGLLPGLLFSVFTRVGVKPRVAWHWMWILPAGYSYLLQAGGIGNDLFGAVFPLAALDFALRARTSGRMSDVCLSILAAVLMTAAKASNLPLLLPWFIAILAVWRIWLPRPLVLAALILPAIGSSFIPSAVLNRLHCGDWTGMAAEPVNIGGGPLWLHVFNNSVMLGLENFVPPVFPFASAWNRATQFIIPAPLAELLNRYFEPAAAHWQLGEMQTEESAGLGFGVATLTLLSLAFVLVRRQRPKDAVAAPTYDFLSIAICVAPWVSLAFSFSKLGLSGVARYCTPYCALLMMGLLLSRENVRLVRLRWWRGWAHVGFGLALLLVILSQARPLWPSQWALDHWRAQLLAHPLGSRVLTVYEVYGQRAVAFAPAVRLLPADASVLGVVTFDDPETSLWRPFGSRRILHVRATEPAADVRRRGIRYVFVNVEKLREPFDGWLQRMNGRVLDTIELRLRAGRAPYLWKLVELNSTDRPKSGNVADRDPQN